MVTRYIVFAFLLAFAVNANAQDYVFVNTDNLILRDRPESTYVVLDILHAGTRLKLNSSDNGYIKDKQVAARFYQVVLNYENEGGGTVYKHGWVEKKYVVADMRKITAPGADTTVDVIHSPETLVSYGGDDRHNPNRYNYLLYRYPKYKGGEKTFPQDKKREYHSGPRGGCYYLNEHGKKVYVEKRYCK